MAEIEGGRVDLYAEHERNSRICERAELIYRKWSTEFRKAGTVATPVFNRESTTCSRHNMSWRLAIQLLLSIGVPAAPSSVKIRVSSPTGVTLSLGPVRDHGKAIVTRFRGQQQLLRAGDVNMPTGCCSGVGAHARL